MKTFSCFYFGNHPMGLDHSVTEENGRGICTVRVVHLTASAKGIVGPHAKYQELKTNAEHLHIEIGSTMATDEQLMFEAAGDSNKGHDKEAAAARHQFVGIFFGCPQCMHQEGEKLWGYMQQAEDKFAGFMTLFASQYCVQHNSVPTLFRHFPPMDDPISQPSTRPSSSSSSPPLPM
ncbi:hypothetical protein M9H77_22543 [Catharanthus roseus]|uniref:Uncharacterized protein n=1 Tax=Catharanthus roseus TaxID=4058 RepID=A0ACC0AQS2_CATRO|nr:hypothetical protein M9H77_22543 [Catharanthus roseus]